MRNLIYVCLSFFLCVPSFSSELSSWESVQPFCESEIVESENFKGSYFITEEMLPKNLGKLTEVDISKRIHMKSQNYSFKITTKNKILTDFSISFSANKLSEISQIIESFRVQNPGLLKNRSIGIKKIYVLSSEKTPHSLIPKILKLFYDKSIFPDVVLDKLIKQIPLGDWRYDFEKFIEYINSLEQENLFEQELFDQIHLLMKGGKALNNKFLCVEYIKRWMDEVVAENPDNFFKYVGIEMCKHVTDPVFPEYTYIKLIENDLMLALPSTTHEERLAKYLKAIEHLRKLDQNHPTVQSQLKLWTHKYINNDQITPENPLEQHQDLFDGVLEQARSATKSLATLRKILHSNDDLLSGLTQENSRNQSRIRELENRLHNLETHSPNTI